MSKQKKMIISDCFDCKHLDEGECLEGKFYCNHHKAQQDGEYSVVFNASDGFPHWCPLDND